MTNATITIKKIGNALAGQEIAIPVTIEADSSASISAIDLVINFDESKLELLSPPVNAGALTESWSTFVNPSPGSVKISQASQNQLTPTAGEILSLNFRVKQGTTGSVVIEVDKSQSSIMEGEITLTAVDGLISVSDVSTTNSSPTGNVVIDGTATQGQTLTANNFAIDDADGLGDFSYQWKADGININGATGNTFVPTEAEVGKAISVVVFYTDGGGTEERITSTPTAAISRNNPEATTTTLTVGTVVGAKAGDTINIPVNIQAVSGISISAIDLVFNFDESKLELLSPPVNAGALTESWSTFVNPSPGSVKISQASQNHLTSLEGEILSLDFKVKQDASGSITIDLDENKSSIMEGEVTFIAVDGLISVSENGTPNTQYITISPAQSSITYLPWTDVSVPITVTNNSQNIPLTTLAVDIHYDSMILTPKGQNNGVSEEASTQITVITLDDTDNTDGDVTTDKIIRLNWTPTEQTTATLATLNFNSSPQIVAPDTGSITESTLNISNGSATGDYNIVGGSANIKATYSFDIDGDGSTTASRDGLFIMRKLFGTYIGDDPITDGGISSTATRSSSPDRNAWIQRGIIGGAFDVDRDGKTTALGDGLMILRHFVNSEKNTTYPLSSGAISEHSPLNNSSPNPDLAIAGSINRFVPTAAV